MGVTRKEVQEEMKQKAREKLKDTSLHESFTNGLNHIIKEGTIISVYVSQYDMQIVPAGARGGQKKKKKRKKRKKRTKGKKRSKQLKKRTIKKKKRTKQKKKRIKTMKQNSLL